MKSISILLAIALLTACQSPYHKTDSANSVLNGTTILLVRHAEKEKGNDPSLTKAGQKRAQALVSLTKDRTITGIYSTNYKRTLETVTPLATHLQLKINHDIDPMNFSALLEDIKKHHAGKTVVIVGHSNTIPSFVNSLSPSFTHSNIDENVFSRLYEIKFEAQRVLVKQFEYDTKGPKKEWILTPILSEEAGYTSNDQSYRAIAANGTYTPFLNKTDFNKFALSTDTDLGTQKTVKMVYDINNNKLYFFDTNAYPFHVEFVKDKPISWGGLSLNFNKNYEGDGAGRDFILASYTKSPRVLKNNTDEMLLELWNGDALANKHLSNFFNKVVSSVNPKDFTTVFHPLSDLHVANALALSPKIPVVSNEELYGDRIYWPLSRQTAVGEVKIIDEISDDTLSTIEPFHIAVFLNGVPNDIGFVAGIVTQSLQTPLSHINVKSKNRGTANMSWAIAESEFKKFDKKFIKMEMGSEGPTITDLNHLSQAERNKMLGAFWDSKKPKLKDKLSDIKTHPYKDVVDLRNYFKKLPKAPEHSTLANIVGAKATNLALLNYLKVDLNKNFKVIVPETVGLPFYFYDLFMSQKIVLTSMTQPKLKTGMHLFPIGTPIVLRDYVKNYLLHTGLLDPLAFKSQKDVEKVLADIRNMYKTVSLPNEIFDVFEKLVFKDKNSPLHVSKKITRMRLRSSTNSEDLPGFTGAGLYESDGVNIFKKSDSGKGYQMDKPKKWDGIKEDLQSVIPILYGGVWNTRAFMERGWFGLNGEQHLRVMCALAIHNAYPFYTPEGNINEIANGVTATRNIYKRRSDDAIDEIYINGQHWDLAVTNPPTVEELKERSVDPKIEYRTEESLITAFSNDEDLEKRADAHRWWFSQTLKTSTLNNNSSVLRETLDEHDDAQQMEARRLAGAFQFLRKKMARVYSVKKLGRFDIEGEWKVIGPDRALLIKQMREFPQN